MTWTVRSVRPTTELMSRIRASGLRATSTSTCPCPVRSVHPPPLSSASVMPSSIELASVFPREKTHEIILACLLTGLQLHADHETAPGGHAGDPPGVRSERDDTAVRPTAAPLEAATPRPGRRNRWTTAISP